MKPVEHHPRAEPTRSAFCQLDAKSAVTNSIRAQPPGLEEGPQRLRAAAPTRARGSSGSDASGSCVNADSSQLGEPSPVQPPRHNPFHDAAHGHPRYPRRRLTAVRSVTCARYAANSSNPDVNSCCRSPTCTCSIHPAAIIPQPRRIRPQDRCRHSHRRRSYRGARFPQVPTGHAAAAPPVTVCNLSVAVWGFRHAHETACGNRKRERRGDNLRWPWGNRRLSPRPPVVALFRVVVEGRDAPVQAGPQGPYLLLGGGTDGVGYDTPSGPQLSAPTYPRPRCAMP